MMPILVGLIITTSAFNTANATITTNKAAIASFMKCYKNVSFVNWKTTELFTKASFKQDGANVEVFYDNEGELIATSKSISIKDLPKNAIKYFEKWYSAPTYTVKNSIEYVTADGEKKYFVSVEDKKHARLYEVTIDGKVSFFKTIS